MIYEIINPSDPYTMESDCLMTAALVCVLLGNGQYGLEPLGEDGERVPVFLFGGHDEWFTDKFGKNLEQCFSDADKSKIAECFNSVLIGNKSDRATYYEGLNLIDCPEKKEIWRKKWLDERRSSMNNIGARANQYFEHYRKAA